MNRVRYTQAEPQGLVAILGGLIQANLQRDPSRVALLRKGVVVIEARDAEVVVTLAFGEGYVVLGPGSSLASHVYVRASGAALLDLANAPLRLGVPDPLKAEGRAILVAIASRRVSVRGLLRSPGLVRRFTMLLSART